MDGVFEIDLGLADSHVLITGGAGQIGSVVVKAFIAAGAYVSVFDISQFAYQHERLRWYQVDITNEKQIEEGFETARSEFGVIATCIALAGLDLSFIEHHSTIADMPYDQFMRTMRVNVGGTFLTAREWLRGIRKYATQDTKNVTLVITGSEAGLFGCRNNADYATSKGAIQTGLMLSMTPDVVTIHQRARVNAIAPGPVDTPQFRKEMGEISDQSNFNPFYTEAVATVPMKQPVPVEAVARAALFLASERYSGAITGQIIRVDNGKSGKVFYMPDGTPC